MVRGCRVGALILLTFAIVIFSLRPAAAFIDLFVEGRVVEARPALQLLGSGLGIAAPLLGPELGVHVDDTDFPVVEIRYEDRTVLIVVDDKKALIDGRTKELAAPPLVIDGTLFVPLTLVADLVRLRVEWDILTGSLALERRDVRRAPTAVATDAGSDPGLTDSAPTVTGTDPRSVEDATRTDALSSAVIEPLGITAGHVSPVPSEGGPTTVDGLDRPDRPVPDADVRMGGADVVNGSNPSDSIGPAASSAEGSPLGPIATSGLGEPSEPGAQFEGAGREFDVTDEFVGGTPVVVRDVQIVHADGHVQIEVLADTDVNARVMFLPAPSRLVIDVDDAVSATGWRTLPGDGKIVQQLRASATEEGGVRFVADLTAPTGYTLLPATTFSGFVVQLNNQLQLLQAAETDNGGVALHMHASGPLQYRTFRLREPERLVIDLFGVSVPGAEELALPGQFATTFRISQYEQSVVRGVFVLGEGVSAPTVANEGRIQPGADGLVQLAFDASGVSAVTTAPVQVAGNGLEFAGFVHDEDLEFILIRTEEPMDANVLRLRGPDRIVLDLPGIEVGRSLGLVTDTDGIVMAVRAGQADAAAGRIVAETYGIAEHHLLLSQDRTRAVLGLRPSGLAGRTIVVDAGHGGKDPGAIGHSGTYEKDVTLAIALQVAHLLGRAGASVVLTRDSDIELTLPERAQTANGLGADAFVSIHADAVGFGRIATGTSTFYHPENGNGPETSVNRVYAQALQRELLHAIGLPDRGIHERAFHVVLNTKMPSALVEVGFIDNPDEEQLLIDPQFQARAAAGIVDGIVRFFAEQAAVTPDGLQLWQARTEQATGAWLQNGVVPAGVSVLEPTALLATASEPSSGPTAGSTDLTASLLAALQERLAPDVDF